MTRILLGASGLDRAAEFNSPYHVMIDEELDVDPLLMSKSGMKQLHVRHYRARDPIAFDGVILMVFVHESQGGVCSHEVREIH